MGYALRHIGDLRQAFREFHRVLKPGGKICLLEITCPESRWGKLPLKIYMKAGLPLLAPFIDHRHNTARLWRYYWDTISKPACRRRRSSPNWQTAGFRGARRYIDVRGMSVFAEFQAEPA